MASNTPAAATIPILPPEVLLDILSYCAQQTLLSCCLTCKAWQACAQPMLFRRIRFGQSDSSRRDAFDRWIQVLDPYAVQHRPRTLMLLHPLRAQELASQVRYLSLRIGHNPDTSPDKPGELDLDCLVRAMTLCPNLGHLSLTICDWVVWDPGDHIPLLIRQQSQLTSNLTHLTIYSLFPSAFLQLSLHYLPSLTYLDVRDSVLPTIFEIPETHGTKYPPRCDLHELRGRHCTDIAPFIAYLKSHLPNPDNLTTIHIYTWNNLSKLIAPFASSLISLTFQPESQLCANDTVTLSECTSLQAVTFNCEVPSFVWDAVPGSVCDVGVDGEVLDDVEPILEYVRSKRGLKRLRIAISGEEMFESLGEACRLGGVEFHIVE